MYRKAISSIYSFLRRGDGDSGAIECSNHMLEAAAAGDLVDFKRNLNRMLELYPQKMEALLVTDGNDWTSLQLAAGANHSNIVRAIVEAIRDHDLFPDPILNFKGTNGISSLIIALSNGHSDIGKQLVEAGCSIFDAAPRNRNAVYLTARNGFLAVADCIIQKHGAQIFQAQARAKDSIGYSALHAAALMGHSDMCSLLLAHGIDPSDATRDGSNALHIACRNMKHQQRVLSSSTVEVILSACPQSALTAADTFGSSPLHVALSCANLEAVKCILSRFPCSALLCQDNDGLYHTHIASQHLCSLINQRNTETSDDILVGLLPKILDAQCCMQELVAAGYPLELLDYSDFTVFHILCGYATDETIQLVGLLIDAIKTSPVYSNLCLVDVLEREGANGLTCLHHAHSADGPCKEELIKLLSGNMTPAFLSNFDSAKVKRDSREHRNRCGAHNRIPIETRRALLNEDYSLKSVANYLHGLGKTPRVVVLIGAGVSTAAGIPDFRGVGGLYADKVTSNMFSVDFLMESPGLFYERVRTMFLPVVDQIIKPTKSHAFLKVLKDLGWLRRVYSQNIDMLEFPMLSEEDVMECHGSFKTATCLNGSCMHRLTTKEDMNTEFWSPIRENKTPRCSKCSSYYRPDVVFFGEPLPDRFDKLCFDDLSSCDMLIVMGTSLLVHPVASLPQMVGPLCVRLLVNSDPSGCFNGLAPCNPEGQEVGSEPPSSSFISSAVSSATPESNNNIPRFMTKSYRDLFYKGKCDDGVSELTSALGYQDQLESIYRASQAPTLHCH